MAYEITSGDIIVAQGMTNHLIVYAGPGAGKTHFLVENIKRLVADNPAITDSKNRKVLCITYTNAAVNEIVRRLEGYTDYIEAYTIHGFIIEHIIRPFQHDLIAIMKSDFDISVNPNGKISSQTEGIGIFHGIDKDEVYEFIRKTNPKEFKNDEFGYSKMAMSNVEVDNDAFVNSVTNGKERVYSLKKPNKMKEEHKTPLKKYMWSVLRKLTHNEILYFGYRILEHNPTALYTLRVKFPFIFVDEFQDTNPLQTLLIKMVGQKSTFIGVVGDIAQSIYSFQGAKPSDFDSFKIDIENDEEYLINGNRRSTQNIINFCNFLRQSDANIVQRSTRFYESEETKNQIESKKIHFLIGDTPQIKSTIAEVVSSGGVVLTRSWAAAFNYIEGSNAEQTQLLKKIYNSYYNTPIKLRDEIVEHNNVTWVRAFRFIFSLWKSHSAGSFIDVVRALKIVSDIDLAIITPKVLYQLNKLASYVFGNIDSIGNTCDIIEIFNKEIINEKYIDLVAFLGDSEFAVRIFEDQDREEIKQAVSSLEWNTSYKLFTEVFSEDSKYMTVHQAKGLEWDKVIVSVTPSRNDKITIDKVYSNPSLLDEDAASEFVRIYYVACSRAKNDLFIHIESGCSQELIDNSLSKFIKTSGLSIEYEFL
jgi:superfamily I DNA/RNA helicase